MENYMDIDEEETKTANKLSSIPYQTQECILYGSIFEQYRPDLERRLAGLCDPGKENFHEHEMSFSLRTGREMTPDVTIKLRRRFKPEPGFQNCWMFRYIGVPEPDQTCPTIVRKVIDSCCYSPDMMGYAKTLGLRMDYEYIAKGTIWTAGKIKIVASTISRSEKPGQYDLASIRKFSDSVLIEMSISLPESAEYKTAAKQLRDFADQFMPLVQMEKVDYWKKYCSTGSCAPAPSSTTTSS